MKDQFLMIRDGDGKDPEYLANQLCRHYDRSFVQDVDRMPKVTRKNVLILKYYSFENYFLDPKIMVQIGILGGIPTLSAIRRKQRFTRAPLLISAAGYDLIICKNLYNVVIRLNTL